MVDTVDDTALTGEPFKAGDLWFRCVVERPGMIRLTWGSTDQWATWNVSDFLIVPEAEVPATIIRASTYEGD